MKENRGLKSQWALNAGPLTSQKLFKWALSILTFIVFGAVAASAWDLPFDPSPAGVRNFLSHIKDVVPLAALAVAIIVLIARAHATVQAAEQLKRAGRQIEISEGQNAFTNYYKHLEILRERFRHLESGENYIIDLDGIYRYLFPHNGPSRFSIEPDPDMVVALRRNAETIRFISNNEGSMQLVSCHSFMDLLVECHARPTGKSEVRLKILSSGGGKLDEKAAAAFSGLGGDLFRIIDFAGRPRRTPAHIADIAVADCRGDQPAPGQSG